MLSGIGAGGGDGLGRLGLFADSRPADNRPAARTCRSGGSEGARAWGAPGKNVASGCPAPPLAPRWDRAGLYHSSGSPVKTPAQGDRSADERRQQRSPVSACAFDADNTPRATRILSRPLPFETGAERGPCKRGPLKEHAMRFEKAIGDRACCRRGWRWGGHGLGLRRGQAPRRPPAAAGRRAPGRPDGRDRTAAVRAENDARPDAGALQRHAEPQRRAEDEGQGDHRQGQDGHRRRPQGRRGQGAARAVRQGAGDHGPVREKLMDVLDETQREKLREKCRDVGGPRLGGPGGPEARRWPAGPGEPGGKGGPGAPAKAAGLGPAAAAGPADPAAVVLADPVDPAAPAAGRPRDPMADDPSPEGQPRRSSSSTTSRRRRSTRCCPRPRRSSATSDRGREGAGGGSRQVPRGDPIEPETARLDPHRRAEAEARRK